MVDKSAEQVLTLRRDRLRDTIRELEKELIQARKDLEEIGNLKQSEKWSKKPLFLQAT